MNEEEYNEETKRWMLHWQEQERKLAHFTDQQLRMAKQKYIRGLKHHPASDRWKAYLDSLSLKSRTWLGILNANLDLIPTVEEANILEKSLKITDATEDF